MPDINNYIMEKHIHFNKNNTGATITAHFVKNREDASGISILIDDWNKFYKVEEKYANLNKTYRYKNSIELVQKKEIITNPILDLEL